MTQCMRAMFFIIDMDYSCESHVVTDISEAKRNGSEVVEDAQIGRILADAERQRGTAM